MGENFNKIHQTCISRDCIQYTVILDLAEDFKRPKGIGQFFLKCMYCLSVLEMQCVWKKNLYVAIFFFFKELILYARHIRSMSNISPILQPKLNSFFALNNFDSFDYKKNCLTFSLLTFISNLYQEIVIWSFGTADLTKQLLSTTFYPRHIFSHK